MRAEVNGDLQTLEPALMDEADQDRLLRLLDVDRGSRRSELDRSKQVAQKATISRLREHIGQLRWLEQLGAVGV